MNRSTYIKSTFILTLLLFWLQATYAQPGDRGFSVVTFDAFGYVGCNHNNFKFYACSVEYPNSQLRSDSLELVWKPDLRSLKIIETLQCIETATDSTGIPYTSCFKASSSLNTDVLMIIRNASDTMLISAGGASPYSWSVAPNGHDLGLPFVFPFQIGLFYLQKLHSDRSTRLLINSIHREYYLSYYNNHPNFIPVAGDSRISYLEMNKQSYHANDTIGITVTGRVLNDGGCVGGSILWTLQRFENGKWIIAKENCCTQMSCGTGPTIASNLSLPLILLKDKNNKALMTYPQQMELPEGKYRFVIYDDHFQPYWTDEFIIH